jgi:hypothetical protein
VFGGDALSLFRTMTLPDTLGTGTFGGGRTRTRAAIRFFR